MGHHRDHLVAALLQPACDLDGLVRADSLGYAERDQSHALFGRLFFPLEGLDLASHHFLRRHGGLLVILDVDARRRSGQELARAGAGVDYELELVGELGTVNHFKMS
jgi:hypothetical protein